MMHNYQVAYEAMKKTIRELLAEQEELQKENAQLREGLNKSILKCKICGSK